MACSIHQDEREPIRRLDAPDKGRVDALGSKRGLHDSGAGVIPKSSEVPGSPSEPRARDEGGGILTTGKLGKPLHSRVGVGSRMFSHGRHQVQAVLAQSDDVKIA